MKKLDLDLTSRLFPLWTKRPMFFLLKLELLEEKDWHLLNSIVLISTSFFKSSGLPLLDTLH